MPFQTILKYIFSFFSVALLLYAFLSYPFSQKDMLLTHGTVVNSDYRHVRISGTPLGSGHRRDIDSRRKLVTVSFQTEEGQTSTFESPLLFKADQYPKGTHLQVLYNPDAITQASLYKYQPKKGRAIIWAVLGFISLGIALYLSSRERRTN